MPKTLGMPVVDDSDWRLQGQEKYLRGAVLQWLRYSPARSNWEHDHCEFCGVEFTAEGLDDTLREGFATTDRYRWICPTCFEDFRARFGWSLAPGEL